MLFCHTYIHKKKQRDSHYARIGLSENMPQKHNMDSPSVEPRYINNSRKINRNG